MTSAINVSTLDTDFPVAGQDNDSQGFRTNFNTIKTAFQTAATEISSLQTVANTLQPGSILVGSGSINTLTNTTNSISTNTGALQVRGGVGIAKNLYVGGFTNIQDTLAVGVSQTSTDYIGLSLNTFGLWAQPELSFTTATFGVGAVAAWSTGSCNLAGAIYSGNTPGHNIESVGGVGLALYTATYVSTTLVFSNYHYTTTNGTEAVVGGMGHRFISGLRLNITTPGSSGANKTPITGSDNGVAGEIRIDSNYIYICTATNAWKRISLSAF